MAKSPKYYVVWQGHNPGIYTSWSECEAQIKGFEKAIYKSFKTLSEAQAAAQADPAKYIGKSGNNSAPTTTTDQTRPRRTVNMPASPDVLRHIEHEAIAVDAACSKNPGPMEYRGVYLRTGKEIFHFGPIKGTNNIGEFLAIVHALALLEKKGLKMTIYSDSVNAMSWVRRKHCKTTLQRTSQNAQLFELIDRAERWLKTHPVNCPILKWETQEWGEIPADFGRK